MPIIKHFDLPLNKLKKKSSQYQYNVIIHKNVGSVPEIVNNKGTEYLQIVDNRQTMNKNTKKCSFTV